MRRYIDGFVLPIARDDLAAYREIAGQAGELWIEHGALGYVEAVGEDLHPDVGGEASTPFPELAGAGPDETVVFAYITFESREHRDAVNAAVFEAMDDDPDREMPVEMARMAYGGFEAIVDLAAEPETVEPAE